MNGSRTALPPPARLEQAALRLAANEDHRAVVVFVETWAELAVPTVAARLAEARSFVELRLVDRAWVRLKDLVECAEPNVEALLIAGEMFLLRGWQNQARKVVQRGLARAPGHAGLLALSQRANAVPPPLDDGITDPDTAPIAELVRVGELHIARGAFVRARTLLERARRRQAHHPRTNELLWAMAGEFGATESLAAMCERVEADPLSTPTEAGDEPEHTESFRVDDLRPMEIDRSFPQLFRGMSADGGEPSTDAEGRAPSDDLALAFEDANATPEVTAVSAMADAQEIDGTFGDTTDNGDDTQIARVMHRGGGLDRDVPPSGAVHTRPANVDGGFNLAAYRREMGMQYGGSDLAVDFGGPEDEDDSVVVHTGLEAEPETSDTGGALDLDTRYERLAAKRKGMAEEAWAAPPPPPPPPAPKADLTDDDIEDVDPTDPRAASLQVGAATDVPPRPRAASVYPPPPQRAPPGWNPPPNQLIVWPYWVVALSILLALLVLVFSIGTTVLFAMQ